MKYYSEITRKLYDNADALALAEAEQKKIEEAKRKKEEEAKLARESKKKARAEKAKEVEDAYKEYQKKLNEFIKTYGAFHMTLNGDDFDNFFFHW